MTTLVVIFGLCVVGCCLALSWVMTRRNRRIVNRLLSTVSIMAPDEDDEDFDDEPALTAPEVFLDHRGVTVYRTYKEGGARAMTYWFSTDKTLVDIEGEGGDKAFDVRSFTGLAEAANIDAWEGWWKPRFPTEPEAIQGLMIRAIEDGRVK